MIQSKYILLFLILSSSLLGETIFGLKVSTYHTVNERLTFGCFTHIAFGPGGSEVITACITHRNCRPEPVQKMVT